MAQPTYGARVIVLRKTKLGESDLILTLLAQDGSQLRAVAKGARRPTSTFAARLELYSQAEVLLARGRSLDIVKEARTVESNERARADLEHASGAAPMAELLSRATQADLENPRLFPLTQTALESLGRADAERVPQVCAAHLLKSFAFLGVRPSLAACSCCGAPLPAAGGLTAFSYREGGAVCEECRRGCEAVLLPARAVEFAHELLHSTFLQVETAPTRTSCALEVLQLCDQWSREHLGARLKSLSFLLTCGLFDGAGGAPVQKAR